MSSSNKKLTILIIGLIVVLTILLLIYIFIPRITLIGNSHVTIEYNSEYEELGSKAIYLGKDLTNKITISGNVDTGKIGKYEIIYKLKYKIFTISKTRVVKVVDKKPPTITLTGDSNVNLCPNSSYEEEGYYAFDEYDKDITDKVKILVKDNKIIYEVKDKSNNKTKVERNITYKDNEEPTITLSGGNDYFQKLDNDFSEPGYSASDNCDGDITNRVKVSGSVNTSIEGKYNLTYTVEDSNGNKTSIVRTVYVYEQIDSNSGVSKNGVIYLTFDDGPSSSTTPVILDILKEEKVKATFFVTNSGPDELIKREYEEGHTVALHTASHKYNEVYSSVDNYFDDLQKVANRVKKTTGQDATIIRFPGGSSNTVSKKYSKGIMTILTNEVLKRGYRYYDWNVDASDAWQCAKSSVSDKESCVYNNVINNLSKSKANIVLMHDVKTHTMNALRDIIKYGKDNGYTFEAITMDTAMIKSKINN